MLIDSAPECKVKLRHFASNFGVPMAMSLLMETSHLDVWTAVVSEATPTTLEKLGKVIDFADPPEFLSFVSKQWELYKAATDKCGWDLLMDGQIILRAVGHPGVLSVDDAFRLSEYALENDPLFDTKLLRRLLANRLWPEEVPADEVLRALEILGRLADPQRLAMTLLKFSKFPDRRVQSKVAKILGRTVESMDVVEELFQNHDPRVRANLLEGISHRREIGFFQGFIERGLRDQNHRVSSFALAIKGRQGHAGSKALMRLRGNSKTEILKKTAEYADSIVNGSSVVAEAAVVPAVAEVDGQAEAHPDKQP